MATTSLPIFFDHLGGVVAQALAIGRVLRENEMTTVVAKDIIGGLTQ